MKRTTYIIVGLLLTGLVVMSASIFYYSRAGVSQDEIYMKITGEMKKTDLPECSVLECAEKSGNEWGTVFSRCKLYVRPSGENSGSIVYPDGWGEYMQLKTKGDTLMIAFDFSSDKLKSKFKHGSLRLESDSITVYLPSSTSTLISRIAGLETHINDFKRDTLSFAVSGFVEVQHTEVNALHAAAEYLRLESGKVERLYLDLDQTRNYSIATGQFEIDTEYLMASGNCHSQFSKGECRQVIWMPRTEGARLDFSINEPMSLSMK